jgi:hypothetical protein
MSHKQEVQDQHEKFVVKSEEEVQADNTPPSRYYIINAFGDYVFVKVRGRNKAQDIVDEVYGKGFYQIRAMGLAPVGGNEVSAR